MTANLVLRPSGPYLGMYNNAWQVEPASPYWQAIDDIVADGDITYLWTENENTLFTVRVSTDPAIGTPYNGQVYPRPTRIRGVLVVATVRVTTPLPTTFKLYLRCYGSDFESESFVTTSTNYFEVWKLFPCAPSGVAWDAGIFYNLEMGINYLSGGQLRCTKMEAHVITELLPDHRTEPANHGFWSDFSHFPSTVPDYRDVSGVWDGDLSRIDSSVLGNKHTFGLKTIPWVNPANIDRIQIKCGSRCPGTVNPAKGQVLVRSAGVDYPGSGTNLLSTVLPPHAYPLEYSWFFLEAEYLKDPQFGWPSGDPAAPPWLLADVNALEVGLVNDDNEPLRCSSIGVDIFLKHTPISVFDQFPTSDSITYASIPSIVPGGAPFANSINEDPPDDAGSYIGADADLVGTPLYGAFNFGPPTIIPPGEQVYACELRSRIRLGATAQVTIAHIAVNPTNDEIYIGKPFTLSGTGATWFDIKEDWYTSPYTGTKWTDAGGGADDLNHLQYGVVILEGEVWVSRIRLQVQTAPETNVAVSDPCDLQLTNQADTIILRSTTDDTEWSIEEFAIGTGGYNPATPTTVVPVNKADVALAAEVARFPVIDITFENGSPSDVIYWCRIPRDVIAKRTVGEIGLYATITWSPFPAEIGTSFLFAILHTPGQCLHVNDVLLFPVKIQYP